MKMKETPFDGSERVIGNGGVRGKKIGVTELNLKHRPAGVLF
jgi:hypothetical protein